MQQSGELTAVDRRRQEGFGPARRSVIAPENDRWRQLPTSVRLHRSHPSQVQRQADEFPLGLHPVQAAHTELSEAQDVLDPSAWRFGQPLASPVTVFNVNRPQPCISSAIASRRSGSLQGTARPRRCGVGRICPRGIERLCRRGQSAAFRHPSGGRSVCPPDVKTSCRTSANKKPAVS